ncbi:hypothetical protein R1flu_026540 [Riccia fluitans]|uniref:Glycosyltransferase family 92 protein n=1 Tax=Riccia fluitans TaxID=41844 RepID=A0ABD1XG93_9MARC
MGWSGEEPSLRRERFFVRLPSMESSPSRQYGAKRRLIGCMLSWVKRVCFSLAAVGFLVLVSSVNRVSFSAAIHHPRKLVPTQQQPLRVNYLRMGYEFTPDRHLQLLPSTMKRAEQLPSPTDPEEENNIRVRRFGSATVAKTPPISADDQEQQSQPYIEDIVFLPQKMDLILVRQFEDLSLRHRVSSCRYGSSQVLSKIINADYIDGRLAITCTRPDEFVGRNISTTNITVDVDDGDGRTLTSNTEYDLPPRWDAPLVYALLPTEDDVILFVKGVFDRRKIGDYTNLTSFKCVFGRGIETEVISGAQEVYRCGTPKFGAKDVTRQKAYLRYKGHSIPSVVYYDRSKPKINYTSGLPQQIISTEEISSPPVSSSSSSSPAHKHLICSCTMVWNAAKFMKEWVLYNSHLGVEKFFLYDNNSEDDIESVVGLLRGYNVSRHFWPWVKTQEAAFSHCAVRARNECVWMLYTDVDEFLFPKHWMVDLQADSSSISKLRKSAKALAEPTTKSIFKDLIKDSVAKVSLKMKLLRPTEVVQTLGQISFFCRNFGPSGLTQHPARGVTQGYICRDRSEQRHKSLVLLKGLKPSLANVIHHFDLRPEYTTVYTDPKQAVINHYKFQAWSEFQTKFTKRASTYVTDWREPVNLKSRDRPEGVGTDAVKPENWEGSHCFMNDTALRNYMRRVFQVKEGENAGKLEWELL